MTILISPSAVEPGSLLAHALPRHTWTDPGWELPRSPDTAVVLAGEQADLLDTSLARLRDFAEAGGSVVLLNALGLEPGPLEELCGVAAAAPVATTEVNVRLAAPEHPLVRGLEPEFPLFQAIQPLAPLNGHTRTLAVTSLRFRDVPLVVERPLGQGRFVSLGFGTTADASGQAVALAILRRALRRRDAEPSGRTARVAVIGYGPLGGMGYRHGTALRAVPGLEFAVACDSSPERLAAAQQDFPGVRAASSAEQVAADPDVDVAIIATPPSSHASLARLFLEAGKHVVCEKPLAITTAETDGLIGLARERNLALTVHQNRRWDGDFLALQRLVRGGDLGDVFSMETFVGTWEHPCRHWHSEVTISGGAEYDWGSHYIDWILQLMDGDVAHVSATAHKRVWTDISNADQVRVRLAFGDGREAEFIHSDVAAIRRPKFYVQGTRGTVAGWYAPLVSERIDPGLGYVREEAHHAEAPVPLTWARYLGARDGIVESTVPPVVPERFGFHRNLASVLAEDDGPLAVPADGVRRVIAVLEAAATSAREGGRQVEPAPAP